MLYSKSKKGFYAIEIHADIPADAVEITPEQHAELLVGQSAGKRIEADAKGRPVLKDQSPPSTKQIIAEITAAVQAHIDAAAHSKGYASIQSAVGYADEPAVPKFQAEGKELRAWRSKVWAKCHELLAEVQAGKREPLDAADVIDLLP